MLEIQELDPNKPDTHVVLREDDVISQSEAKWFRHQLKNVAGTNPHGQAILQMRWGPVYEDPMQTTLSLKYQDFTKDGVVFGERRWIIEIWRSPAFLVRSGRYQVLHDPDNVQEFWFCRACDIEMGRTVPAPPARCLKCGSGRFYVREIRESGNGKLLADFPREGCYDYWLRLERANLTYHPPDNEALTAVKAIWQWELTPQNERDAIAHANSEQERRQMILENRRRGGGTIYTGAVHPFQIPR